jgi:hypothetical protein
MPYDLRQQEYEVLVQVSDTKRYVYSLKRIADWEEVWSLSNAEGWVLMGDAADNEVMPIWPHPRFAQLCITEDWADREPRMITLEDWRAKWLPGLSKDNRMLAVFPVPGPSGPRGTVVTPDRFGNDLQEQLDMIE